MTSKHLSIRRLSNQLTQQSWWLIVFSLFSALGTGFIYHFLCSDYLKKRCQMIQDDGGDINSFFFHFLAPTLVVMCFAALGILAAVIRFSYLHSQRKVDFYHSQPVSSTQRFFGFLANDSLCPLLALLINLILQGAFCIGTGVASVYMWKLLFMRLFLGFLAYILSYALGAFATIVTNNLIFTALFGLLITFGLSLFILVLDTIASTHLQHVSNDLGISWFSISYFYIVYRLVYVYDLLEPGTSSTAKFLGHKVSICDANLLLALLAFVLLLLLSYLAYYYRKNEKSSMATPFTWLKVVCKLFLLAIGLPILNILVAVYSTYAESEVEYLSLTPKFFLTLVILTFILHVAIDCIIDLNIKSCIKPKNILTSLGAMTFLIALIACFQYDWLGIDSFVPKAERVETVDFSVFQYKNEIHVSDAYDYFNPRTTTYNLTCTDEACELAKVLLDHSDDATNDCDLIIDCSLTYHMKNGKVYTRCYEVPVTESITAALQPCFSGEKFLALSLPFFYRDDFFTSDDQTKKYNSLCIEFESNKDKDYPVYFEYDSSPKYNSSLTRAEKDRFQALKEAYKKDLAEHPTYSILNTLNNDKAIYQISIEYENQDEIYDTLDLPVYDCFTNTKSVIEAFINDPQNQIDDEE